MVLAGLELTTQPITVLIFLPLPPKFWNYSHASPFMTETFLAWDYRLTLLLWNTWTKTVSHFRFQISASTSPINLDLQVPYLLSLLSILTENFQKNKIQNFWPLMTLKKFQILDFFRSVLFLISLFINRWSHLLSPQKSVVRVALYDGDVQCIWTLLCLRT